MTQTFAEFLITSIVMELTPGPNMAWLALLSAREGLRAGFVAVAAAAGFAAAINTFPIIYQAIRWGGVSSYSISLLKLGAVSATEPTSRTNGVTSGER